MDLHNLFNYISYQIFFIYLFFYIYSLYFPIYDYIFYSIIGLLISINSLGFILAFIHRYNFNKIIKNIFITNLRNLLVHIAPLIHLTYSFDFIKSNIITTNNSLLFSYIIVCFYIFTYFVIFKKYKLYLIIWNIKINKLLIYLLIGIIFVLYVLLFLHNLINIT